MIRAYFRIDDKYVHLAESLSSEHKITIDIHNLDGTDLDAFAVYSEFTEDIPELMKKHFPGKPTPDVLDLIKALKQIFNTEPYITKFSERIADIQHLHIDCKYTPWEPDYDDDEDEDY